MDSSAEEKLQNMGEIVAVTAARTIFCSGIDSAAKSKAQFDIKKFRESLQSQSRWSSSRPYIDTT